MKNANFIAIDFETATMSTKMPCQIGIVVVKNGEIVEKINRYIQPPKNIYSKKCISVHGITPDVTINEPDFYSVWKDVEMYFDANFVVAHNISFDLDVLSKAINRYGLKFPILMGTECTYRLTGASLDSACKSLGINMDMHHDALSDATACAKIFLKYLSGQDVECESFEDHDEIFVGEKSNNEYFSHEKIKSDFLKQNLNVDNKENPFYNKKVVITGIFSSMSRNDIAMKLQSLGADINVSISKRTDYLIKGEDAGQSKLNKVESLNKEGCCIDIIDEEELISMLLT